MAEWELSESVWTDQRVEVDSWNAASYHSSRNRAGCDSYFNSSDVSIEYQIS